MTTLASSNAPLAASEQESGSAVDSSYSRPRRVVRNGYVGQLSSVEQVKQTSAALPIALMRLISSGELTFIDSFLKLPGPVQQTVCEVGSTTQKSNTTARVIPLALEMAISRQSRMDSKHRSHTRTGLEYPKSGRTASLAEHEAHTKSPQLRQW